MLEHSAMYLNVTPPYEDEAASFFPDLYSTRFNCELHDPVWAAKMSALTGIKQKRKKVDNKPQTQINKCNNEKLRREKENYYIDELANLISDNFSDMSSLSVKPDKCAILQETVNQIRRIKQQENANQTTADPVQQGEVSSSRPTILSNDVFGPLLLEALEGFLFVISSDGKVEYVTENVSNYIKYSKDEVTGKSIYNFIHHGDHNHFHTNLLPMTVEWNDQPAATRSKSIDIRFLVKQHEDLDETVEEKTQRLCSYELMHISSTQLREQLSVSDEGDASDNNPCLLCIASRISHRDKASCSFEQFTTKLDATGKIIGVDTSNVAEPLGQVLRKDFKDRVLRDFVPAQDLHRLNTHLRETLNKGTSISAVYRIQVAPDNYVKVQTKSKFFKTNTHANSDTDFIMATHSIISDDALGPGDPGGGNIGGPLMTSVVNGAGPVVTRNGPSSAGSGSDPTPPSSSGALMQATAADYTPQYLEPDDFNNFDFPSSTWTDLGTGWSEATRSESRQSVTPVSTPTPRPPSNPSYSNTPTVVQSPLAHFSAQQSPANQAQQQQQNQNSNFNPFSLMEDYSEQNCYPVEEQKDTKANVLEEAASLADSHRLRILLTNPPTSSANSNSSSSQQDENRDRILKELLNQQDDDQGNRVDNRSSPRGLMSRGQMGLPPEPPKASTSTTGNNMLRQLLNDKSDDDDIEAKTGMKKPSELLQQLLKKGTDDDDDKKNDNGPQEDTLLRSLGFPPGSPAERRGSKRSLDEKDDRDAKRANDGSQVSSSGSSSSSELCKRNKMLASLLAKQTPAPPSIPPIPQSVISATPQDKLPTVYTDSSKLRGNSIASNNNIRPNNASRLVGRPPTNYLNNNVQRPSGQLSGMYTNQATSTSDNNNWVDNNNLQANIFDPDLSELLDQVIDIVPEDLEVNEAQQPNNFLSETAAINIIENSLRQYESAVKSPTSPNISLPARPPAYPANVSSQNNLGYPPPPNYPQNKYQRPINVRSGAGPPYGTANITSAHSLLIAQQRRLQLQDKQRLLQQQKQQQLLIPSNATATEMNSIQNIDSLLNNTVAPNVSLQRSNSVPESQLSPNYNAQLQNSNSVNKRLVLKYELSQANQRGVPQQPQQQPPYSPHSQLPSPLNQQSFQPQTTVGNYNQQAARLSPQSQYSAQLSPRQGYPQGNGAGSANWSQQRISVQQNPMLNAQLMRPPTQSQQQQRSLNSPGLQAPRHSPFAGDQFPPPTSPNSTFNQTQYLQRLQRANSVPTTSTNQMTGGLGSPRPYPGNQAPPHYPSNPLQSIPPAPMLYPQQDAPYNCYEQPQGALGYERRGSAPPHLPPGIASSGPTSEFVRQELRAVVGARTGQSQSAGTPRSSTQQVQQLQQMAQQQAVDLESLGLTFEMPSGASESPKLWGTMGSEMGSISAQPATSRTTMEEGRPGDTKTSLLQQLLSDQSK
ncbi:nuclear receptor coactivator 2 isoform X3 [Sitophilus oryzae]|uniref:Nuclear receptor coactivator 2 isoform X3 n=1 Tax=Sitophilus oryzae TaxID=7048 RepID=A0A6J2YPZ7_SITOR|nr:nuclear receptor coactivator 2 isoform X3 [Sitophilus oryzae]